MPRKLYSLRGCLGRSRQRRVVPQSGVGRLRVYKTRIAAGETLKPAEQKDFEALKKRITDSLKPNQ